MDKQKKVSLLRSSRESGLMGKKELKDLRDELSEVQSGIKFLNRKKSIIKNKIHTIVSKGLVLTTEDELDLQKTLTSTFKLYVLKLDDECWYIGSCKNVNGHFERHVRGKGAYFTKMHKPIRIYEIIDIKTYDTKEASMLENSLTLKYAKKYGTRYVRGGGYSQTKPKWPLL